MCVILHLICHFKYAEIKCLRAEISKCSLWYSLEVAEVCLLHVNFQNRKAVLTILAQKLNNFTLFTQVMSKYLLPWVGLSMLLSHFLLKS